MKAENALRTALYQKLRQSLALSAPGLAELQIYHLPCQGLTSRPQELNKTFSIL